LIQVTSHDLNSFFHSKEKTTIKQVIALEKKTVKTLKNTKNNVINALEKQLVKVKAMQLPVKSTPIFLMLITVFSEDMFRA